MEQVRRGSQVLHMCTMSRDRPGLVCGLINQTKPQRQANTWLPEMWLSWTCKRTLCLLADTCTEDGHVHMNT